MFRGEGNESNDDVASDSEDGKWSWFQVPEVGNNIHVFGGICSLQGGLNVE